MKLNPVWQMNVLLSIIIFLKILSGNFITFQVRARLIKKCFISITFVIPLFLGSSLECIQTVEILSIYQSKYHPLPLVSATFIGPWSCANEKCSGKCQFCVKLHFAVDGKRVACPKVTGICMPVRKEFDPPDYYYDTPYSECGGPEHKAAGLLNISSIGCRNVSDPTHQNKIKRMIVEKLSDDLKLENISARITVEKVCVTPSEEGLPRSEVSSTTKESKTQSDGNPTGNTDDKYKLYKMIYLILIVNISTAVMNDIF